SACASRDQDLTHSGERKIHHHPSEAGDGDAAALPLDSEWIARLHQKEKAMAIRIRQDAEAANAASGRCSPSDSFTIEPDRHLLCCAAGTGPPKTPACASGPRPGLRMRCLAAVPYRRRALAA